GAARAVSTPRRRLRSLLHGCPHAAAGPDSARRVDRGLRGLRRALVRAGMIPARWTVAAPPDPRLTSTLAADLHIPEPLAAILVQRGLAAPALARAFLRPELERLSDPLAWADMPRAVDLIATAVRARAPILVHGDYDVDGQCAAALLTRVLSSVGGNVRAFVPHRLRDGYDFGPAGLVQALVPALGLSPNLPLHFLDLVALATVADVVPLTGENRILVRHGLKMLADSRWTGVRALVDAAGLTGKPVKSGHVGFILAPRLNAAGRIDDANLGLRLLLSDDPAEAAAIARELETLNARRQALDQRILDEAVEQAERVLRPEDRALVLAADAWHPGVIGIVASRLVERYG